MYRVPHFLTQRSGSVFTIIDLPKNNRMVRLGFGQHDGLWFIRVDLWFKGFRLAQVKHDQSAHIK